MKKLFTIILMAATILTACTKENIPVACQIVTINATIAGDTKVALGEGENEKKVNWTEGDVINLTIDETQYPFTWQEGTTFAYTGDAILPALTQGMQITATHASNFNSTQTGMKANVGNYMALSAEQTVTTEQSYGDLNLTFSHGTSVLKLTLSNDAFKGNDVTGITLKAGSTVVATATETFKGDADNGYVTIYFAIPSTSFNMQNVSLSATCGGNKYFGTLTNKELTSGKLYNAIAPLASACFLPQGSTFKSKINTFLENNTTLTKIQFIADTDWVPEGTQIETCGAYMVANTGTQTLEIRTATSCFVFNENCQSMFSGSDSKISTITSIDFGNSINTMQVNNMRSMFYNCKNLVELKLGSSFNTGSVTTMRSMFYNCQKLTEINLSSFNTQNVQNMYMMFCYCEAIESLDLSSFNTSNATNMHGMFAFCSKLNSLTFGSNFNTANVNDMRYMFQRINNGNSNALDLNLTGFTFKSEVNIEEIFQDAGNTNVRVTETGYNFLKNKKTYNITFVKENGTTPWE